MKYKLETAGQVGSFRFVEMRSPKSMCRCEIMRIGIRILTRRSKSDIIEVTGRAGAHNAEARIVQERFAELQELQSGNE